MLEDLAAHFKLKTQVQLLHIYHPCHSSILLSIIIVKLRTSGICDRNIFQEIVTFDKSCIFGHFRTFCL